MEREIDLTLYQDRPVTKSSLEQFAQEILQKIDDDGVTQFRITVLEGENSSVFELKVPLEE